MEPYLEILHEYGRSIDLFEHSRGNAAKLAKGRLPMVMVLQEPCNLADEVDYDTMVYGDEEMDEYCRARVGCPTLQEVEKLIENAPAGKGYGLKDVSVFDLNVLHSPKVKSRRRRQGTLKKDDLDKAHDVFWEMILEKSPEVILVLTCIAEKSNNENVKLLKSSLRGAGEVGSITLRKESGETKKVTVVKGFHPSCYLREDYIKKGKLSPREVKRRNALLQDCVDEAFSQLAMKTDATTEVPNKELTLAKMLGQLSVQ